MHTVVQVHQLQQDDDAAELHTRPLLQGSRRLPGHVRHCVLRVRSARLLALLHQRARLQVLVRDNVIYIFELFSSFFRCFFFLCCCYQVDLIGTHCCVSFWATSTSTRCTRRTRSWDRSTSSATCSSRSSSS